MKQLLKDLKWILIALGFILVIILYRSFTVSEFSKSAIYLHHLFTYEKKNILQAGENSLIILDLTGIVPADPDENTIYLEPDELIRDKYNDLLESESRKLIRAGDKAQAARLQVLLSARNCVNCLIETGDDENPAYEFIPDSLNF